MARLEALLSGMPGDRELRLLLEQLDPGPGGSFTWLDPRNTAITVLPASHAFPVQVLLELRGRNELGVLVTSREGLISHGEHLSLRQPADAGVVRRFGLTHTLLRRKDPLD